MNKKTKPDFIFSCRKCNHHVFVGKDRVQKLIKYDCSECGEECGGLWVLEGEGDFDNR